MSKVDSARDGINDDSRIIKGVLCTIDLGRGACVSFVTRDGVDIHYDTYRGEGESGRPWLTFAHGAGGNAASWWQQVPYFFDDYDIMTFDHRAFGRSRCGDEAFDPDLFVDDLRSVLDAEDIHRTALCCQSMGGRPGLDFALSEPDRVSALVMSHTVGGISSEAIDEVRRSHVRPQPAQPFGSWAVALDLPEKNRALSHLYNCIGAMNLDFSRVGLGGLRSRGKQIDSTEMVAFRTPTLFITADKDVVVPPRVVEIGAAMVPGATLVNLGDAGHSSYFEIPDQFNRVVREFLQSHQ